jgi:hypothetical protein
MQRFKQSPILTLEGRAEAWQWLLHNVILGFAGVWVPCLALRLFGVWRFREAFLNGDLTMFAVTLSAVSLGFFTKESQISLRKRKMFIYAGLMVTMIVGVITRTAIAFSTAFPAISIEVAAVELVTVVAVLAALFFNFRLFTAQLTEVITREQVRQAINEPALELTEKAKQNTKVDDIKL